MVICINLWTAFCMLFSTEKNGIKLKNFLCYRVLFFYSQKHNQFLLPAMTALHRPPSWASSIMKSRLLTVWCMPFSSFHSYTIFGIQVSVILYKCLNHCSCLLSINFIINSSTSIILLILIFLVLNTSWIFQKIKIHFNCIQLI